MCKYCSADQDNTTVYPVNQQSRRPCVNDTTTMCKSCCVSYSCSELVWTLGSLLHLGDAENLFGITRSSGMTLSHMTISNRRETLPPEAHTLFRRLYLKGPFQSFCTSFHTQNLSQCVIQYDTVFLLFSHPCTMNGSERFTVGRVRVTHSTHTQSIYTMYKKNLLSHSCAISSQVILLWIL